jgi:hypothetical protein
MQVARNSCCEALVGSFYRKIALQKQRPQKRIESGVPRGHMQVAVNRLYEAFLPGCQAHAPAPT